MILGVQHGIIGLADSYKTQKTPEELILQQGQLKKIMYSIQTNRDSIEYLDLAKVNIDPSILPRECLDRKHVLALVEELKAKERQNVDPGIPAAERTDVELDPLHVFNIDGKYHLSWGQYSYQAYREYFKENPDLPTEVPAIVITGTWSDYYGHTALSNVHDKPQKARSQADKRKAVEIFLLNPKNRELSDREIGRTLKVDGKTVGKIRSCMEVASDGTVTFKSGELIQFPKQKNSGEDSEPPKHSNKSQVSPGINEDKLKYQIEQLNLELAQRDKELQLMETLRSDLAKAREELDELKEIADSQNIAPILEELDKLKKENQELKSQTSEEAPHPRGTQLIKEVVQVCTLTLSRIGGCSAVINRITDLIEPQIDTDKLEEIKASIEEIQQSEAEKRIEEMATEKRELIQQLDEKDYQIKQLQEATTSEPEVKKSQNTSKLNGEDASILAEIDDMGGWEKLKADVTQVASLKVKIEKFEGLKKGMRAIANLVEWTPEEIIDLCAGKTTEPVEKLKAILQTGLPRDPDRQIEIFKRCAGFERLMKQLFENFKVGEESLLDQLSIWKFKNVEKIQKITKPSTQGLLTSGGETIPWLAIYNGHVQFSLAF